MHTIYLPFISPSYYRLYLSSSSAYYLKFSRATDSHLLVVPGICFGSEAKMNPRQRKYTQISPIRPELGITVICKLWTRFSSNGMLATPSSLVYSLYYHSGHKYYQLAARLAPGGDQAEPLRFLHFFCQHGIPRLAHSRPKPGHTVRSQGKIRDEMREQSDPRDL